MYAGLLALVGIILLTTQISADELKPITDREYFTAIINEHDRQYQQRFEAQEKALAAALSSAKEAVDKANAASEKRFDSVNEFRNSLKDQASAFLPRPEYAASQKQLSDQISAIQSTQVPRSEHETRCHSEAQSFTILNTRIEQLSQRAYTTSGQSEGSAWLWGIIAGGIGLAAAMITVILNVIRRPAVSVSRRHYRDN